ncbi:hypothetical protein [Pseudonocardia sp. ICBG162]
MSSGRCRSSRSWTSSTLRPEERSVLLVAHGGMIAGMVCGLLDLPQSSWP